MKRYAVAPTEKGLCSEVEGFAGGLGALHL
jgi:hypothetical protein